jgi:hypothetical protein
VRVVQGHEERPVLPGYVERLKRRRLAHTDFLARLRVLDRADERLVCAR